MTSEIIEANRPKITGGKRTTLCGLCTKKLFKGELVIQVSKDNQICTVCAKKITDDWFGKGKEK